MNDRSAPRGASASSFHRLAGSVPARQTNTPLERTRAPTDRFAEVGRLVQAGRFPTLALDPLGNIDVTAEIAQRRDERRQALPHLLGRRDLRPRPRDGYVTLGRTDAERRILQELDELELEVKCDLCALPGHGEPSAMRSTFRAGARRLQRAVVLHRRQLNVRSLQPCRSAQRRRRRGRSRRRAHGRARRTRAPSDPDPEEPSHAAALTAAPEAARRAPGRSLERAR
jgi:hypothetical protein